MKNRAEKEINKRAYSIEEFAYMIGISKGHARNEIFRGNLKALKSGRRILITAEEIQRYLSKLA